MEIQSFQKKKKKNLCCSNELLSNRKDHLTLMWLIEISKIGTVHLRGVPGSRQTLGNQMQQNLSVTTKTFFPTKNNLDS